MIKIKKLLKYLPADIKVKGLLDLEVTGASSHAQRVAPGNVFIAKRGATTHGARFLHEAIACGAAAVITDLYDPSLTVTQLIVPDPAAIEGAVAAACYGFPSRELTLAAVTGTNGKTTSAYLLRQLLGPHSCGLTGTIEYCVGNQTYPATHTTSDACTNQRLLREMVSAGCRTAVMEVTSHALEQGRVDGIEYTAAIFTNLSSEHLDYHGTMEAYCAAKKRLFDSLRPDTWALINYDSSWSSAMVKECRAQQLTYGITGGDLTASAITACSDSIAFRLNYRGTTAETAIPLIGEHNVYNALGAAAAALTLGISLEKVAQLLPATAAIPGRLERISNPLSLRLYVDFAHTPDALEHALTALSGAGRIITVFGCGGDRDATKRPIMGAISERYSALTIVTNDNPRTEDPEAIAHDIISGFQDASRVVVELDRSSAIARAVVAASPGDTILIAGKGHETHQIFAQHTTHFDDRQEAARIAQSIYHSQEVSP